MPRDLPPNNKKRIKPFEDPAWLAKAQEEFEQSVTPPPAPMKEEVASLSEDPLAPTQAAERKSEKALRESVELTAEEFDFDASQVSDWGYLQLIFGKKYDKYRSLDYLMQVREKLGKLGYPEGPLFNTIAFLSVILRRLEIVYQEHHVLLKQQGVPRPEDLPLLKQIQDVGRLLGELQKTMEASVERQTLKEDVHSLHEKTMHQAEEFIRSHAGEFAFRCQGCGKLMNTQGLPYWAVRTEKDKDGGPLYHVFSSELWYCVERGLIGLPLAAFILQTSIEGVLVTAKIRKERFCPDHPVPEIEKFENQLAELRKPYEDEIEREQRRRTTEIA